MKKFLTIVLGLAIILGSLVGIASAQTTGIPALLYHQISSTAPDNAWLLGLEGPTVINIVTFTEQMKWLYDNGYRTLTLQGLRDVLSGKVPLPTKTVVITFDDGWTSQFEALVILKTYKFNALFSVLTAPEWVDGPYMSGADFLYLDRYFARHHRRGSRFDIVSHGVSHPDMVALYTAGNLVEVNRQFTESKQVLQAYLGHVVDAFTWPYGEYNQPLINLAVQAGYRTLFTVNAFFNTNLTSPLAVNRTTIDGRCGLNIFIQSVQTAAEIWCGP